MTGQDRLFTALTRYLRVIQEAAGACPAKRVAGWKIWSAAAACAMVGILIEGLLAGGGEMLELSDNSYGVTAEYVDTADDVPSSTDQLVPMTEEECFTSFDTAVFEGQITEVQNICLDFNGSLNYRALAKIKIERVFRGGCKDGEIITLPAPGTCGRRSEDDRQRCRRLS